MPHRSEMDVTDRFLRMMLRRTALSVIAAAGMAGCAKHVAVSETDPTPGSGTRPPPLSQPPHGGTNPKTASTAAPPPTHRMPASGPDRTPPAPPTTAPAPGAPLPPAIAGAPAPPPTPNEPAPPPTPIDDSPRTGTCEADTWTPFAGLDPTPAVDYLALIYNYRRNDDGTPFIAAEQGTRCDGASDMQACLDNVGERERALQKTLHAYYLLTTDSDTVTAWHRPELPALLGPIDTPDEALLVLHVGGQSVNPCGDHTQIVQTPEGWRVTVDEGSGCLPGSEARRMKISSEGEITVTASGSCVVPGRRPPGWIEASHVPATTLGEYFAWAARAEAGSVPAFAQLADELASLAAPGWLVARARAAAREEATHARVMARLARRHGTVPAPVRLRRTPHRSLFSIALDNAREGCVNETYSALITTYQAACATDPEVRDALSAIADEEAGHAAFSHALDRWLRTRLSAPQREAVQFVRDTALAKLRPAPLPELRPEQAQRAGLPSAETQRALVGMFRRTCGSGRPAVGRPDTRASA